MLLHVHYELKRPYFVLCHYMHAKINILVSIKPTEHKLQCLSLLVIVYPLNRHTKQTRRQCLTMLCCKILGEWPTYHSTRRLLRHYYK